MEIVRQLDVIIPAINTNVSTIQTFPEIINIQERNFIIFNPFIDLFTSSSVKYFPSYFVPTQFDLLTNDVYFLTNCLNVNNSYVVEELKQVEYDNLLKYSKGLSILVDDLCQIVFQHNHVFNIDHLISNI